MIEIIIALLAGIWIGRTVSDWINQITFRQILNDLNVSDQQLMTLRDQAEAAQDTIEIKLEQHGDEIYAYHTATDQFLAQGTTREQVLLRVQQAHSQPVTVKITAS